jgi:hypothetical protein
VTNTPWVKLHRIIVKLICHFVRQMILYLRPLLHCTMYSIHKMHMHCWELVLISAFFSLFIRFITSGNFGHCKICFLSRISESVLLLNIIILNPNPVCLIWVYRLSAYSKRIANSPQARLVGLLRTTSSWTDKHSGQWNSTGRDFLLKG